MAIQLRACEEVAARLGTPTLEGLKTRLTPIAPCLECGWPIGQGPATLIGQQYGDKALVLAAHEACRSSEWIRCEETDSVEAPIGGDATVAVELIVDLPAPRGLGWLARLVRARLKVPTLLVFPLLGWAWVELVAPGETINDDLSFYRDRLGLTSQPTPGVALPDAQAWIAADGNLVAAVRGYRFATSEQLPDQLAAATRKAGFIQLLVATGVEIGPDGLVSFSDLETAGAQGRLAGGMIRLGEQPAEPGSPPPPRQPGQRAPAGLLADERTRSELGAVGMREVTAALWPVDCQTCGAPLGTTEPALFVQDAGAFFIAGLHHPQCRRPGWNDQGPLITPPSSTPTVSFTTRSLLIPRGKAYAELAGQPLLLVNPSLELVFVERDPAGQWRVMIDAEFTSAGMVPPGGGLQPGRRGAIRGASAQLHGDEVTVTLPGLQWPSFAAPVAGPGGAIIAQRIRELGGLFLGITHMLQPDRFAPADLAQVIRSGQIVLGWISLSN